MILDDANLSIMRHINSKKIYNQVIEIRRSFSLFLDVVFINVKKAGLFCSRWTLNQTYNVYFFAQHRKILLYRFDGSTRPTWSSPSETQNWEVNLMADLGVVYCVMGCSTQWKIAKGHSYPRLIFFLSLHILLNCCAFVSIANVQNYV